MFTMDMLLYNLQIMSYDVILFIMHYQSCFSHLAESNKSTDTTKIIESMFPIAKIVRTIINIRKSHFTNWQIITKYRV